MSIAPATPFLSRLLRSAWLGLMLLLTMMVLAQPAKATTGVLLDGIAQDVDAWDAVSTLSDPDGSLDIQGVLTKARDLQPVQGPHANLGSRQDVVWMRVPVRVATIDGGRWLADIDYASLDRIDLHLVRDGVSVRHFVMGDHLPYKDRPVVSRSHRAARSNSSPGPTTKSGCACRHAAR